MEEAQNFELFGHWNGTYTPGTAKNSAAENCREQVGTCQGGKLRANFLIFRWDGLSNQD